MNLTLSFNSLHDLGSLDYWISSACLLCAATKYLVNQVVMVHSGSQANGLAIQLARAKTGATDVIVFEHSFHGRYLFDILYSV